MARKFFISIAIILLIIAGSWLIMRYYMVNKYLVVQNGYHGEAQYNTYSDAGKTCFDSSQCLGRCFALEKYVTDCLEKTDRVFDYNEIICDEKEFTGYCEKDDSPKCFQSIFEIKNKKMTFSGQLVCD